jgi:hypothetical protein
MRKAEVDLVVGLVAMELGRFAAAGSASGLDRGDRYDQRLESIGIVGIGCGRRRSLTSARYW